MLEILYEDDHIIAINKPHGLLVHRSKMAADVKVFAMQMLRDQIGQKVYPAHRLDRKTSGVLLFAKSPEYNSILQKLFREGGVQKEYQAIVRGFIPEHGVIDYPLKNENKVQPARTDYQLLEQFEIREPLGKFPTSRYSRVSLKPETGRFHQLRKHMAHIFHPIIGDRPHGCNKQNRMWKERFAMDTMLLHAVSLSFQLEEEDISIKAKPSEAFHRVLSILREGNI